MKKQKKGLTPQQKKLVLLLPMVSSGKLSMKEAMLRAGYAESSADQQTKTLNSVRASSVMQEALRKKGFTEELIAGKIMEGLEASKGYTIKMGEETVFQETPDAMARHKYLETGAKLLDVFPAAKVDAHLTVDDACDDAEKAREYAPWDESAPAAK